MAAWGISGAPYGIHRVVIDLFCYSIGFPRRQPKKVFLSGFSARERVMSCGSYRILPLFQGNMLYCLSVVVEKYQDL